MAVGPVIDVSKAILLPVGSVLRQSQNPPLTWWKRRVWLTGRGKPPSRCGNPPEYPRPCHKCGEMIVIGQLVPLPRTARSISARSFLRHCPRRGKESGARSPGNEHGEVWRYRGTKHHGRKLAWLAVDCISIFPEVHFVIDDFQAAGAATVKEKVGQSRSVLCDLVSYDKPTVLNLGISAHLPHIYPNPTTRRFSTVHQGPPPSTTTPAPDDQEDLKFPGPLSRRVRTSRKDGPRTRGRLRLRRRRVLPTKKAGKGPVQSVRPVPVGKPASNNDIQSTHGERRCENCKLKKAGCDSAQPTCERCQQKGERSPA